MKLQVQKLLIVLFLVFINMDHGLAQEASSISEIISKIQELEKKKDPKCYATANRLEDFMYGTPLEEDARNLKIEIQKEIILILKEKGTAKVNESKSNNITKEQLKPIIESISNYKIDADGNYRYQLSKQSIIVLKKDMDQYSSVSYGYRSLLSVEQDLLYIPEASLLSFDDEALQYVNNYINIITLVALKIADNTARNANQNSISKKTLKDSFVKVFNKSKAIEKKIETDSSKKITPSNFNSNSVVIDEIIKQKIASYEVYNQLASSVFLRNVQVYFAKQKWPVDNTISSELKNYYLESLILFTNEFIKLSNGNAVKDGNSLIRVSNVQTALNSFLPSTINSFEDVTYFPNNLEEKISIESYDLDAFRDSGFHWRILSYSLADLNDSRLKSIDPIAAELLVEGIAMMGVLVLRMAGINSHNENKTVLDNQDINHSFIKIQALINSYDFDAVPNKETQISSAINTSGNTNSFEIFNEKAQIDFEHKSSDWLNRLIRSYTTSYAEGVIKLAIPPAFGGSGVACEDINNDGLIDVLLLGGFGNKLFLNSSEGVFKDITEISKINKWNEDNSSYGEPRQPIIADFNNDGTQDIFISYVNENHRMLKNIDGKQFEDVSEQTNLGGDNSVAGPATAFDYNNDGLLDIFIGYFGNYVEGVLPTLSRDNQNGMPNKLFKNTGNFVFEEVSFTNDSSSNSGWTQALGHSDINQDGLQDIIVGNDFGVNKYFLNSSDGVFTEVSKELGTDKPSYTMNVGIADLNKDLFPDFYISNIVVMQKDEKYVSPNSETTMKFDPDKMANIRTVEANDLFLSQVTKNQLVNFKLSSNVGRGYSSTGWSWDADFFDYDNDGDVDLYCLNGMNDFSVYSSENPFYFERKEESKTISYAPSSREKNVFFVNDGGELINKAAALGTDLNSNARSASYFDFDEDGDLDIIINNYHEKATLLRNNLSKDNNWVKVKLVGDPEAAINRDAIGSTIILNSENHKNLWREIHSTTGYLSVHPKQQHFGVGTDEKVNLEIRWSNGESFILKNLSVNSSFEITYPDKISAL